MKRVKKIRGHVADTYRTASANAYHFTLEHSNAILATVGMIFLVQGLAELSHADGFTAAGGGTLAGAAAGSGGGSLAGAAAGSGGGSLVGGAASAGGGVAAGGLAAAGGSLVSGNAVQACSRSLGYLQGGFGTLVASAAGIGAIVSAALGGFKAAWCLFVVSVGCFILRTYLTLFMTGC